MPVRQLYPNAQLLDELIASFRRAMIGWALLTTAAGLIFFLDPTSAGSSSVRQALQGPLDEAWSLTYAAGGLLAALGCRYDRPVLERPGLVMLIGAMGLNLAAIGWTRGIVAAVVQMLAFSVAFWVFGLRLRYLERERQAWLAASRLQELTTKYDRRGDRVPDNRRRRRGIDGEP